MWTVQRKSRTAVATTAPNSFRPPTNALHRTTAAYPCPIMAPFVVLDISPLRTVDSPCFRSRMPYLNTIYVLKLSITMVNNTVLGFNVPGATADLHAHENTLYQTHRHASGRITKNDRLDLEPENPVAPCHQHSSRRCKSRSHPRGWNCHATFH
jgi:hypothetical protein